MKLLIIGLDGATFDIMWPLIEKHKLPALKKIMEEGVHGELESTIPPLTGPAWVSFMTGKNSGKHGIFSFMERDVKKYDGFYSHRFVTSNLYSGSTFIDLISSQGYKMGVITLPMTYPPWKINGVMISGYPCPDTDKIYSYSQNVKLEAKEKLNFSADYYEYTPKEKIIDDGLQMMETRTDLAVKLVKEHGLDCLILVLGAIDRSQHDFWRYYDSNSPFHDVNNTEYREAIPRHYQIADSQIEKLLSLTDENTRIFIISDHGGAPHPMTVFNTNCWLKKMNLLVLKERKTKFYDFIRNCYLRSHEILEKKSKRLAMLLHKSASKGHSLSGIYSSNYDWRNTRAFRFKMAYPVEGIVINLKGRQDSGTVEVGDEYEELRNYIIRELEKLRDPSNKKKVFKRCYRREEIFSGKFIEKAPDIVIILNEQYIAGEGLSDVFTKVNLPPKHSGVHSLKGILIAKGPVMKSRDIIKNAKIIDIAPTILFSMNMSIPRDMDGHILYDIFLDKFKIKNPPKYHSECIKKEKIDYQLTLKEEEEIKKKLRALGYIDT